MNDHVDPAPFFIGWSNDFPAALRRFYLVVGLSVFALFALLGLLAGNGVDNGSLNIFSAITGYQAKPEPWLGDQHYAGTITLLPYPILHASSSPGAPVEKSILLSGSGKRGAPITAATDRLQAFGGILRRGDIDMLVIDDAPTPTGLVEAPPRPEPPRRSPPGRSSLIMNRPPACRIPSSARAVPCATRRPVRLAPSI